MDIETTKTFVKGILQQIEGSGELREGLVETPSRVAKAYLHLFSGYSKSPEDVMKTFTEGACEEMVVVKNIEFYSTCEHHMIPFFGKAHIAYIPNGRVIGISKLARLLEIYARRLQIQERLGAQVVDAIMKHLNAKGAMCVIEAQHLCMCARGVEKQGAVTVTSAIRGAFNNAETRNEFLQLVK